MGRREAEKRESLEPRDSVAGARAGAPTATAWVLGLQRSVGNRAVTRLLRQAHPAPAATPAAAAAPVAPAQAASDGPRPLPPEVAPGAAGTTVAFYELGDERPMTGGTVSMQAAFRWLARHIAGARLAFPVTSVEEATERLRALAAGQRRIRRVVFVGHGFAGSFAMQVRRREGQVEAVPDMPGHTASFRFASAGVTGENAHVQLAHAIAAVMRGQPGSIAFIACSTGAMRDMPGATAFTSLTRGVVDAPGGGPSEIAVHGFGEPAHIFASEDSRGGVERVWLDRTFDVHVTQAPGRGPNVQLPGSGAPGGR